MASTAAGEPARQRRTTTNGAARRKQLMGIAARSFAQRGYAQTTVRDIADEAGLLSGSIYHHFDSKEAIACELLADLMENLQAGFADVVVSSTNPREALDGLVRFAFTTIHERQDSVATYQNESALFATMPAFAFVTEASKNIERIWRGVLEEGRADGYFRADIDPGLVYLTMRDAVWSTVRWYNPDGRYPSYILAEQFLKLLHGGLTLG